ncbi:BT4734/BF3469 family protein [Maribacter sp. 2307UL18-2]|uniref:BT4734/BF3469 family protein n=1 Tax=Maribacter sp. 2307UL18-2 TaxID=3386274 RepID=UPI0039BD5A5F
METNLLKNTVISQFNRVSDTLGEKRELELVLNEIRSNKYVKLISGIRATSEKKRRTSLKMQLPAVTFAGTFSKRAKAFCTQPSGLICLDFDGLRNAGIVKEKLARSKYCLCIFISPSGNGLKMLVRIPLVIGDERYKEYYNAALLHYGDFRPDTSTKDISRLCFLSHDPKLYLNENAEVFTKRFIAPVSRPKVRNLKSIGSATEGARIKGLFKWWKNNHWDPSARNNSLYKLAAAFCEYGVSLDSAWAVIRTYEEPDLDQYELKKLTDSAYKRITFNAKEFV